MDQLALAKIILAFRRSTGRAIGLNVAFGGQGKVHVVEQVVVEGKKNPQWVQLTTEPLSNEEVAQFLTTLS